jgi:hypothetical protein
MKISTAFPSEYLKAGDLNGKAVRVVIETVTAEKIGDDTKPVLHFLGKDKTLVLNKTNANRIVEATGTDETDDWAGWSILLYACKVDFQGKRVDAIRVDDRPGSTKRPVGVIDLKRRSTMAPVPEEDAPAEESEEDPIPF